MIITMSTEFTGMLYVSGMQELNLPPCSLNTPGDWHIYGIVWDPLNLRDSDKSVFKKYGIEAKQELPFHKKIPCRKQYRRFTGLNF